MNKIFTHTPAPCYNYGATKSNKAPRGTYVPPIGLSVLAFRSGKQCAYPRGGPSFVVGGSGICVNTYNCARVHVGSYSIGDIKEFEQYDTYRTAKAGFKLFDGRISIKKLNPLRVNGGYNSLEGRPIYSILKTILIYPVTDTAVISVFNHNGKRILRLTKNGSGERSTMFKSRL